MKAFVFSKRVAKEILRDPINLFFGLAFPLILLLLMTVIQRNAPVQIFELESLTPGICVFGLSFMTLFSATIVSKDRSSSYISRLYTTPLRPGDYILGYTLPLFPVALAQAVVCYAVAVALGLKLTLNVLWAILLIVPMSLFFISLGLLCGVLFNDKQVGGICGALVTNLTAFLSGAWLDISMLGSFGDFAKLLPFYRATELGRAALSGDFVSVLPHLVFVLGYGAAVSVLAVLCFKAKMKKN